MNERFWDKIAGNFDEEVFDTLKNDRNNIIVSYIDRFRSLEATACDLGCGTGRYLPTLAERFKTIYAIDISSKCLDVAQEICRPLNNVIYIKADLSVPRLQLRRFHFGISINMLTMPSFKTRGAILRNFCTFTKKHGYLLLVVPSLESALYSNNRLLDWNAKSGSRRDDAFAIELNSSKSPVFASDGVLNFAGARTKHYLKEELIVLLEGVGFSVISVAKVEYPWTAMFGQRPPWMKGPYPWDWLVLCTNKC